MCHVSRHANPRMTETRTVMAVSETSDMSRDVSFPCCYRSTYAYAHDTEESCPRSIMEYPFIA